MEMKINTLVALITMTTLSVTDFGIVKAICWAILFINFIVLAKQFEVRL